MKIAKYIKLSIALVAISIAMVSCIENDIPYPRIQPNFVEIEAEYQSKSASIDTINRKVTLFLSDIADIKNVNIINYALTPGASIVGTEITGGIDLSQPLNVSVKLYQEYNWEISAEQQIDRYFVIANKAKDAQIDKDTKCVVLYVTEAVDISKIEVKSVKLGSSQSKITPNIENTVVDFSSPITIDVTDYNRTEKWTISVERIAETTQVDAWTQVAWVSGLVEDVVSNKVEYRLASEEAWSEVPSNWITYNNGNFTARIIHLQPNTTYIARSYSNNQYSNEVEFTTGSIVQVPNSSFDDWWQDGKVWCPWLQSESQPYWGTGNKGAATVGKSNSTPTDVTATGSGLAARLESKYIVIKFAAGNIFTGDYVKTDGTNGVLDFGREFNQRPTKLKGYYNYDCKVIDRANTAMAHIKGQPDTCSVWIALTDWENPFQIRTNPKNQQLFDENDSHVIAFGRFQMGENNPKYPEYEPFEVVLNYRDTQRVPKYIVIAASASKYGDFFTGGVGSVLCIDEFKLEYDYTDDDPIQIFGN